MFYSILSEYENPNQAIGEIVESTHFSCTLSSYSLGESPRIGEFLVIRNPDTIIVGVSVGSQIIPQSPVAVVEPLRKRVEDLEALYVDLSERFRDLTKAILVGYLDEGEFTQGLPPHKPKIHTLVFSMKSEHIKYFLREKDSISARYLEILATYLSQEFPLIVDAHFKYLKAFLSKDELRLLALNAISRIHSVLSDREFLRVGRVLKEVI